MVMLCLTGCDSNEDGGPTTAQAPGLGFPSWVRHWNNIALGTVLAADLAQVPGERIGKVNGIDLGRRVAAAILAMRSEEGSNKPEPRVGVEFVTSSEPGKWHQDPIRLIPLAVGAYWGKVKPFVLLSADQFRVSTPPSLSSPEYAVAYNEESTWRRWNRNAHQSHA